MFSSETAENGWSLAARPPLAHMLPARSRRRRPPHPKLAHGMRSSTLMHASQPPPTHRPPIPSAAGACSPVVAAAHRHPPPSSAPARRRCSPVAPRQLTVTPAPMLLATAYAYLPSPPPPPPTHAHRRPTPRPAADTCSPVAVTPRFVAVTLALGSARRRCRRDMPTSSRRRPAQCHSTPRFGPSVAMKTE